MSFCELTLTPTKACYSRKSQESQAQQKGGRDIEQGKEKLMTGNMWNKRSMDTEGSQMSRDEIELLPGQDITARIEGVRYLESTLLTVPGTPYTTEALTGAPFQISRLPGIKTNSANVNAI
jgi:hypothetical protein